MSTIKSNELVAESQRSRINSQALYNNQDIFVERSAAFNANAESISHINANSSDNLSFWNGLKGLVSWLVPSSPVVLSQELSGSHIDVEPSNNSSFWNGLKGLVSWLVPSSPAIFSQESSQVNSGETEITKYISSFIQAQNLEPIIAGGDNNSESENIPNSTNEYSNLSNDAILKMFNEILKYAHDHHSEHSFSIKYFNKFKNCTKTQMNELVNVQEPSGMTPLHRAVMEGNSVYVEWLLKNGARTDVRNYDYLTPLDYALDFALKPGRDKKVISTVIKYSEREFAVDTIYHNPLKIKHRENLKYEWHQLEWHKVGTCFMGGESVDDSDSDI